MLSQPVRDRLRFSALDHIDGAAGLQIDQDRGVPVAASQREIVHAQHGDRADIRIGYGALQVQ